MNSGIANLGMRISQERDKIGLTRNEFSEIIGITPSFLEKLENGKKNPSVETLEKLSTAVNKPVYAFFMEDSEWRRHESSTLDIPEVDMIEQVIDFMLRLPESYNDLILDQSRIVTNFYLRNNNS